MNLSIITGLVYATLGLTGLMVIMFGTSPMVSDLFQALGFAVFVSLFGYGLYKAAAAELDKDQSCKNS